MRNALSWYAGIILLNIVVFSSPAFSQQQDEALSQDVELLKHAVPDVSETFVAQTAGLDEETLALIQSTADQRQMTEKIVSQFTRKNRSKLLTYRAIWMEMRERYRNLIQSALENAFDPCQFVTDEALSKSRQAMYAAKEKFEAKCREVHGVLTDVFDDQQIKVISNASTNLNLVSPFRWLSLTGQDCRAVARLIRVYEARMQLAKKFPHLKQKLSEEKLYEQVRSVLTNTQCDELSALQMQWGKNRADTP